MSRRESRYSIALEWCGYAARRYVARFCGDWIGQAPTMRAARKLAQAYERARWFSA